MLRQTSWITEEDIRKKVDDEDIFRRYFGDFKMNHTYSSKFREDKNPSTTFYTNKQGTIQYMDYATREFLTAIPFVMKLYGVSYGRALEIIGKDFNIIPGEVTDKPIAPKKKKLQTKKNEIKVGVGSWEPRHLDFWKQFCIGQKELEDNNVYPVSKLIINDVEIPNCKTELRFAYIIRDIDGSSYYKIYSPYSKEYKWVSNNSNRLPFGLYELPFKSNRLIITKSQKDRILFKKYFSDVIAVQNESWGALDEETIEMLNNNYDQIIICFDIDHHWNEGQHREVYPGKEASQYFQDKYGWQDLALPDAYYEKLGIKDCTDLVKERGLQAFEKFLKYKELI